MAEAMLIAGVLDVTVLSADSTFVMPWFLRASAFRTVMASAVSTAGLAIMEPVTTTVCSWGAAVVLGETGTVVACASRMDWLCAVFFAVVFALVALAAVTCAGAVWAVVACCAKTA